MPALLTSPNQRFFSNPGASLDKSAFLPLFRRSRKCSVFHSQPSDFFQIIASKLPVPPVKPINRPEICAPIFTTSRPTMFGRKTFLFSLVILCSLANVSCSYYPRTCAEPAVRREWRAFSTEEKAEWIRAINVRNDAPPQIGRFAEAIFVT